jgi:hypothetical protein
VRRAFPRSFRLTDLVLSTGYGSLAPAESRGYDAQKNRGESPMNTASCVSIAPVIEPTAGVAAHLDRLGDEITQLSAHLDAATAHLLDLIREFDAGGGWNTGFCSCAAWLTWRVGLDPSAARERVRVARALGTLPRLAQDGPQGRSG